MRVICSGQIVPINRVPDIVVFVKTSQASDLIQAICLKNMGARIVYDLCDNLFHKTDYYMQIEDLKRWQSSYDMCQVIKKFLTISDCVVVPTETLRDCLLEIVPDIKRIIVFPDPVILHLKEPQLGLKYFQFIEYMFGYGWRWAFYKCIQVLNALLFVKVPAFIYAHFKFARLLKLPDYLLMRLQFLLFRIGAFVNNKVLSYFSRIMKIRSISGLEVQNEIMQESHTDLTIIEDGKRPGIENSLVKDPKNILWFGNVGLEGLFGISDLLVVKDELEALYKEVPFTLTVISNDQGLFEKLIRPLMFESVYLEWSEAVLENALTATDVVIVPQSKNKFSSCKSANRPLLALSHGVPVIASSNPSLRGLEDAVLIENWQANIKNCFHDKEMTRRLVEEGRAIISRQFMPEKFVSSWEDLLISLKDKQA